MRHQIVPLHNPTNYGFFEKPDPIKSAARIAAMVISYHRNQSLIRSAGAGIIPYIYLAYVAYDHFAKK
jgi:hypothetical protein